MLYVMTWMPGGGTGPISGVSLTRAAYARDPRLTGELGRQNTNVTPKSDPPMLYITVTHADDQPERRGGDKRYRRRTVLKLAALAVLLGAGATGLTLAPALRQPRPPTSPYPFRVVKFSTRRAGETVREFFSRQTVPTIVDFENIPVAFSDFAEGTWHRSATDNGGWGLLGGYVLGTINARLSMRPWSSTKTALVKALPLGATTNYQLMRLGLGAKPNVPLPAFFTGTLDGTRQGHQYTGMQSYETDHAVFGPFTITGIVGVAGGQPPWETFAWGSYHDKNPTWTDFEIDGRDASGVPVTASGIGAGPQDEGGVFTYQRGYIHDLAYGGGITHYRVTNTTLNFIDMHLNSPYAGLNFERCDGTVVNVVRPNFDSCGVDIVADSDTGFATIRIVDPVLTAMHPKVVICVHAAYDYPGPALDPNKQIDAASNNHVSLTVAGVSRPDLIEFVSTYGRRT
jgi:hypothetical protein